MSFHKLDNPVWHALQEVHQHLSVDYGAIKFYHPDSCPFGGFDGDDMIAGIEQYASLIDNFFVLGEKPKIPKSMILKGELICLQMIIDKRLRIPVTENLVPLTSSHTDELVALVNLVQPGYFKPNTTLMGDYFGIFKNGNLVAATGERMKTNDFTEVSAVVTHPDHVGRGYAKQLVTNTVNLIFDQHKTPFLHVAEKNVAAIYLYEKLGFVTRRKISLWNIGK